MVWWLLSFFTFSVNWDSTVAQSNASCLPFYNWTYNSVEQSPCQVASSLLAVCNDGPFPVSALPDQSHQYVGPSLQDANTCQCNTVTYSLMSACGACQGSTYLSWSVWSANCPIVYLRSYPEPIPSGVLVPGWAYLDVQADDDFDQSLAKMNANLTQSTAVPSPTDSKQSKAFSSATSSTTSAQSTSTPSSLEPSSGAVANVDAIGGGVVGGLLGLFTLCVLLYGYIHWKRRLVRNGELLSSRTDTENPSMTQVQVINSISPRSESAIPSFNYSLSTPDSSTSSSSVSGSMDFVRSPDV